jgi:pantoate--beta-alanine ligase
VTSGIRGLALAGSRAELAGSRATLAAPVVLVPTMGALHEGHRALLRRARELAGPDGAVVVSIFVNPLQFAPGEDLDRYPRTLDDDLAICAAEGARLVFTPAAAEMYPGEQLVTVDPGPAGQVLEGEFRPGFFAGVLTVVLKLFSLVRPDVAVFGEKDAQQLALVRRMVTDFALGIEVESVPTVRDDDGLATSSRNRYLSPSERAVALALPRALAAGREAAAHGPRGVLDAGWRVLQGSELKVDYLALVDPATFRPVRDNYSGRALLAAAARAGSTRLIDNVAVSLGTERDAADD